MKLWILVLFSVLVFGLLADASPVPGKGPDHNIDKRSPTFFFGNGYRRRVPSFPNFGFPRFSPQYFPSRRFDQISNFINDKHPDYEKFLYKRSLDDDFVDE